MDVVSEEVWMKSKRSVDPFLHNDEPWFGTGNRHMLGG